jgi:hypothetical protein
LAAEVGKDVKTSSYFTIAVSIDEHNYPCITLKRDGIIFKSYAVEDKFLGDNVVKITEKIISVLEDKHIIYVNRLNKRDNFISLLKKLMLPLDSDIPLCTSLYRRSIDTPSGNVIIDLSANDAPNVFELYIDNLRITDSDVLISVLRMIKDKCQFISCSFEVNGYINHNTPHTLNLSFTGKVGYMQELEPVLRKLIVMGIIKNTVE